MLRSSLCDYSDAYILVKRTIAANNTVAADTDVNNTDKNVLFKSCAPLTNCIIEINNTKTDKAKDIDIVMPVYDLIEYNDNYSIISGNTITSGIMLLLILMGLMIYLISK